MVKKVINSLVTLSLLTALFPQGFAFAYEPMRPELGGISNESAETQSQGILERIKGFFGAADELSAQKDALETKVNEVASSGWVETASKVWTGTKSFFSDTSVQQLLIETGKLGLRITANIFKLIASVIEKVLGPG